MSFITESFETITTNPDFMQGNNVDRFFVNLVNTPVNPAASLDYWDGIDALRGSKIFYITQNTDNTVVENETGSGGQLYPAPHNLTNGMNGYYDGTSDATGWPKSGGGYWDPGSIAPGDQDDALADLVKWLGNYIANTTTDDWVTPTFQSQNTKPIADVELVGAYVSGGSASLSSLIAGSFDTDPIIISIQNYFDNTDLTHPYSPNKIATLEISWFYQPPGAAASVDMSAAPFNVALESVNIHPADPGGTSYDLQNLTFDSSKTPDVNTWPPGEYIAKIIAVGSDGKMSYPIYKAITLLAVYGINLSPSTNHDFGKAVAGYAPLTAHSVTITNTGNVATGELDISLSGGSASDFTLSTATITSLAVSGSDSFTVEPKTGLAAGLYSETVTVYSAANGISEFFSVNFEVKAQTYGLSLNPSTDHDFGSMIAGYAAPPAALSVTITNNGNVATGELDISLSGGSASDFTLSTGTIASLAVSGSDSFTVEPKPGLAAGLYSETVTVYNAANGDNEFFTVIFKVEAQTYGVSLNQPTDHDFGSMIAGYPAPPAALSVTITNTGNQPTGPLDIDIIGANPSNFTLSIGSITSGLAAGGATSFTVVPNSGLSAGIYNETLVVSGINVTPQSFDVTFTVTAASSGGAPTAYIVTFNSNGGSALANASVFYGNRVTKPADPVREGYDFDDWYTDEALTTPYDFTESVTGNMTLYAGWVVEIGDGRTPLSEGNPFRDVAESDWFYAAVMYVYENDLMLGTGADMFSPQLPLTRGMLVTILWRMEEEPDASGLENPFDDVPEGEYYTDAVKWAAANEIVLGYGDDKYGPDDNITREQLVTILWRYCIWKGIDVSVGEDTNILSYNDAFDISEYAIAAFQWACGAGVIEGKPGGYLDPQGGATRAEIAAMLHRYLVLTEA